MDPVIFFKELAEQFSKATGDKFTPLCCHGNLLLEFHNDKNINILKENRMSENMINSEDAQTKRMVLMGAFLVQATVMASQLGAMLALPSALSKLGSENFYGIVVTSYVLAMAIAAPVGGKLGDLFGRKNAIFGGTITFATGNILCAISTNFIIFYAGFLILAMGMGLMLSLPVAMIGEVTTDTEFPKFMGFYTMVNNIAMVTGPILSGLLMDFISPKLVYIYLLPLGAVALWIIHKNYEEEPSSQEKPIIDYLGILFLIFGAGPILLLFNLGGTNFSWLSLPSFALLATGIIFIFIFIKHELKFKEPIIAVELFKIPSVAMGYLRALVIRPYSPLITSYLLLFAQQGIGISATVSGTLALPKTIAIIMFPALIGAWIAKKGVKRLKLSLITGGVVIISGLLVMSFASSTSITVPLLYVATFLIGIGHSFYYVSNLPHIKSQLPPEKMGSGIAIYTFISVFAMAFYGAIFGGVLNAFDNDIYKAFPTMNYIAVFGVVLFILLTTFGVKVPKNNEEVEETSI